MIAIPFPPELNPYKVIIEEEVQTGSITTNRGRIKGPEWISLEFSAGWMCGCCGAGSFENIGFNVAHPENFLSALMKGIGFETTRYFIAADYQLHHTFLQLMLELGARQIDDTLNQNHGPNHMYMHVWAPNLNRDKIFKYIDSDTFDPPWWSKISDNQKREYIKTNQQNIDFERNKLKQEEEEKEQKKSQQEKIELYDLIQRYPDHMAHLR